MSGIDFSKLPNLFIIGAAKAGTTSLHDVLSQHPEIFMSKDKEPNFFNTEDRFALGLKWYQKTHFKNSERYPRRGESTTGSLFWSTVTAPRIKEIFGGQDIKFIASFRDPVKRAYSYYWMKVHHHLESLSFEDALAGEEERMRSNWEQLRRSGKGNLGYYRGGCYATLLQPFLDYFPRSNFAFILLEDFQKNFSGTMAGLAGFLEVHSDYNFRPVQSNSASAPRIPGLMQFLQHPSGPLHRLVKLFSHRLPLKQRHQIKSSINRVNLRPQEYLPMKVETERSLRLRYLDEVERLELIIERDLSAWKPAGVGK